MNIVLNSYFITTCCNITGQQKKKNHSFRKFEVIPLTLVNPNVTTKLPKQTPVLRERDEIHKLLF